MPADTGEDKLNFLNSAQAFVVAALAGMGWGVHPEALIAGHLANGALQELVPDAPLDVLLYGNSARAASTVLAALADQVQAAARGALLAA